MKSHWRFSETIEVEVSAPFRLSIPLVTFLPVHLYDVTYDEAKRGPKDLFSSTRVVRPFSAHCWVSLSCCCSNVVLIIVLAIMFYHEGTKEKNE